MSERRAKKAAAPKKKAAAPKKKAAAPKKKAAAPKKKAAPKKRVEAPKTAAVPERRRRLAPLPPAPFVPREQIPEAIVDAIAGFRFESLPSDVLLRFVRPAIGFVIDPVVVGSEMDVGRSKFGGRPDLPPEAPWPVFSDAPDRALPFLLQVNTADLQRFDLERLLPKRGIVSFFADTSLDVLEQAKVVYGDDPASVARAPWPDDLVHRVEDVALVAQLPEHAIVFHPSWTLPSADYLAAFVAVSDADRQSLRRLEQRLKDSEPEGARTTRLLGWPSDLGGEFIHMPEDVIVLQLDASMAAPPGIRRAFRHWGEGIVHFVVPAYDLADERFDDAEGFLAYA